MNPLRPPPESTWPRDKLFRLFMQSPRPRLAIDFRHPLAPHEQLYARSLTGTEHRECLDYADSFKLPELRYGSMIVALLHRALWAEDRPIFKSRDFITQRMHTREISLLGGKLVAALNVISPYYSDSDWEAWQYAFRNGSRMSSNISAALSLGQCFEDTCSYPERFFNVPRHELTDGQWMVFRGARSHIDDMRKKK